MKNNRKFLQELSEAKSCAKCKRIIQKGGRKQITALAEVAKNVLQNRLKIPKGKKRWLCNRKRDIRRLASRLTKFKEKKKIAQTGGFPLIAQLLASTAIPYIIKGISALRAKRQQNGGKQNKKTGTGRRR